MIRIAAGFLLMDIVSPVLITSPFVLIASPFVHSLTVGLIVAPIGLAMFILGVIAEWNKPLVPEEERAPTKKTPFGLRARSGFPPRGEPAPGTAPRGRRTMRRQQPRAGRRGRSRRHARRGRATRG